MPRQAIRWSEKHSPTKWSGRTLPRHQAGRRHTRRGRFWHAGEKTDIYVEALVVHVRTDHDVPDVAVMQGGPPTVGTRVSVIEDTGFGAAVGARHAFGEATEVEGTDGNPGCGQPDRDHAVSHWTPATDGACVHRSVRFTRQVDQSTYRRRCNNRNDPAIRLLRMPTLSRRHQQMHRATARRPRGDSLAEPPPRQR